MLRAFFKFPGALPAKHRCYFAAVAGAGFVGATISVQCHEQCHEQATSKEANEGSIKLKNGRSIFFKSCGEGVPVFAFHGMGSAHTTWDQEKPEPGIRLIAVDRPGYGSSSPPPAGYSYRQFVSDLTETADQLGLDRFCVAGHSSGGPYALAAAALLPQRVVSCAAISSDPPYYHPKVPEAVRQADVSAQPVFGLVEERLAKLGIEIKKPVAPVANYVPWHKTGNVVYISGQIPKDGDLIHKGQVGGNVSVEAAAEAARLCGLNLVAQMREACNGNLDRVTKILQVQGFVASTPDFFGHPQVINGVSDLLVEVFGKEVGAHSRFAVGCSSLPLGVSVEVGAVIEIDENAPMPTPLGFYGVDPVIKGQYMAAGAGEKRQYNWKQGPLGFVTDYALERLPWSFKLEEISQGERLTIWVGEKDIPVILHGAPFLQNVWQPQTARALHNFSGGPDARGASPAVRLWDAALPEELFGLVRESVDDLCVWRTKSPAKMNTFWLDRSAEPRTAAELAGRALLRLLGQDHQQYRGIEWWCRNQAAQMGAHFHYDTAISATSQHAADNWVPFKSATDEVVAEPNMKSMIMYKAGATGAAVSSESLRPTLSSVLYLGDVGGPTMILNQVEATMRREHALAVTARNRWLVFPGNLFHGAVSFGANEAQPTAPRFVILFNFWAEHRPAAPSCQAPNFQDYRPVCSVSPAARHLLSDNRIEELQRLVQVQRNATELHPSELCSAKDMPQSVIMEDFPFGLPLPVRE
ncbi:TCP17, partial [Symbiodinium sp. KB8]